MKLFRKYYDLNKIIKTDSGLFKSVKIPYRTAANYLIHNYMLVKRIDLVVAAYPDKLDDTTDPVWWGFRIINQFDHEVISAGAYGGDGHQFASRTVKSVIDEANLDSYEMGSACFIEQVALEHSFNTRGLLCKATPSLVKFLTCDDPTKIR